jgi:hypothetical protein
MKTINKQDGNQAGNQLVNQYETDSNRNVRIIKLENVVTKVYDRIYLRGLIK